jgi:hypothetical protein
MQIYLKETRNFLLYKIWRYAVGSNFALWGHGTHFFKMKLNILHGIQFFCCKIQYITLMSVRNNYAYCNNYIWICSGSKERFAIKRYLLMIGKKQNMQVLSHTYTYIVTSELRHLSYRDTSLLIPSSYQKAAWLFSLLCGHLLASAVPNVNKFCGIANVRWQFRTKL